MLAFRFDAQCVCLHRAPPPTCPIHSFWPRHAAGVVTAYNVTNRQTDSIDEKFVLYFTTTMALYPCGRCEGCGRMRPDWVGWDRVGWDRVGWDWLGRDWLGWHRVGWHLVGWDQVGNRRDQVGNRRDQVGWDQVEWQWVCWVCWDVWVGLGRDRLGRDRLGSGRIGSGQVGIGSGRVGSFSLTRIAPSCGRLLQWVELFAPLWLGGHIVGFMSFFGWTLYTESDLLKSDKQLMLQ